MTRRALLLSSCLSIGLWISAACFQPALGQEPADEDEIVLSDTDNAEAEPDLSAGEQPAEIDLGSTEVVGERTLQSILGESHTLTTLSAEEFAGAGSISEALERVPGMDVRFQGGQGQLSTAQLRGSRANQVLVLLDGQPLAAGVAVDLSTIPLPGIASVEVLRGPEAARFGAGAVGGVVNFITKQRQPAAEEEPLEFPLDEHKAELAGTLPRTSLAEVELSAGSHSAGGVAFTWSDDDIALSFNHQLARNDYGFKRAGESYARRQNNDARQENVLADWEAQGLRQRLSMSFLERGVPGSAEFPTLDARFAREQLLWQGSADDWRLGFNATHARFSDPTPYLNAGEIDSRSTRLRLEWAQGLLATQRGEWGVKPYVEYLDSSDYGTRQRFGIEALRRWTYEQGPGDWEAELGVSAASEQGLAPLARLGWSKQVNQNMRAYGAAGYAVRFPDFEELYLGAGGPVQGNPALHEERALSAEAGMGVVRDRVRFDCAAFYTKYDDAIIFVPVSGYAVRAMNTGPAAVAGLESLLDWNLGQEWWWRTAYTWLPIAEYDSGIPLSGRAGQHCNSRIEWAQAGTHAAFSLDYTGSMPADLFGSLVLKPRAICGLELSRDWERTGIKLNVGNLLDKQARDSWNYPLPGREWTVTWRFKL